MAERKFTYQGRSKEDWSERANMRGGQFDSFIKPAYKLYKAKDGKNVRPNDFHDCGFTVGNGVGLFARPWFSRSESTL